MLLINAHVGDVICLITSPYQFYGLLILDLPDESIFFRIYLILKLKSFREELFAKNCITSSKTRKMCILHLEPLKEKGYTKQVMEWPHPNSA